MSSIGANKGRRAPLGRCCDWRCRDNCGNKVGRRRRNVIRQLRIGSRRIDKKQRIAAGKRAGRLFRGSNRLGKSHTQNKKARSADLQAVISLKLRSLCVCQCGQNCCCCQYSAGLGQQQAAKINEALQKKRDYESQAKILQAGARQASRAETSQAKPSQVEPSRIGLSQLGLPPSH